MTQFTLALSDELTARLRTRAQAAGCATVEQYLTDLIEEHIEVVDHTCPPGVVSAESPDLEAELLRRLDDPRPPIEPTTEFWEQLKQCARDQARSPR